MLASTLSPRSPKGLPPLKPLIDTLTKIVDNGESFDGTAFDCPGGPSYGWSENGWTRRLTNALKLKPCFGKVVFTAEMGKEFSTEILKLLRVSDFASPTYFMFRGAPDIIIQRNPVVTVGAEDEQDEEEQSSSSDDVVENSRQTNPLEPGGIAQLPDKKIGELFGSLHFILVSKILRKILVSKILRKIKNNKKVQRDFTVNGLLIDKVSATSLLSLSVNMKVNEAVKIVLHLNGSGGCLSPGYLCSFLEHMQ